MPRLINSPATALTAANSASRGQCTGSGLVPAAGSDALNSLRLPAGPALQGNEHRRCQKTVFPLRPADHSQARCHLQAARETADPATDRQRPQPQLPSPLLPAPPPSLTLKNLKKNIYPPPRPAASSRSGSPCELSTPKRTTVRPSTPKVAPSVPENADGSVPQLSGKKDGRAPSARGPGARAWSAQLTNLHPYQDRRAFFITLISTSNLYSFFSSPKIYHPPHFHRAPPGERPPIFFRALSYHLGPRKVSPSQPERERDATRTRLQRVVA